MAKPVVLYVEDEENDIIFMRHAFRKAGIEHDLESVFDGKNAVAYLSGRPPYDDRRQFPVPSLILLDVNLPVVSGFEVLDWIRRQSALNQVPVIMFSSSGRPEDRRKAQELGANNYVLKPASGAEFVQIAESLKHAHLG